MKTREFINLKIEEANKKDKEESAVLFLLANVLNVDMTTLYSLNDEELSIDIINKFNELFDLYLNHNKPLQYLIHSQEFYGYDFYVDENVLIPRFETEELVENVIYRYDKYFKGQEVNILDLACGSGCIGITLAKEIQNAKVDASDISEDALKVAKYNNEKLKANVNFILSDMFLNIDAKYDIIVSNPPYIPTSEEVMSLVYENEPHLALFGGDDGLKFYEIILKDIKKYLKPKALIAFEHGYDKKAELAKLIEKYLPNTSYETIKDLEQKDRMTFIYYGGYYEK